MGIINIGELIRSERKKKGITQEELSFDLCTTATLSRIENGIHIPGPNLLADLLARLGNVGFDLSLYADEYSSFDNEINSVKELIVQLARISDWEEMHKQLLHLEIQKDLYDALDRQFIIAYRYLYIYEKGNIKEFSIDELTEAIRLTISSFSLSIAEDYLLSTTELFLFIFLFKALSASGENDSANSILTILTFVYNSTDYSSKELEKPYFYLFEVLIEKAIEQNDYKNMALLIDRYNAFCRKHELFSFLTKYAYFEVKSNYILGNIEKAKIVTVQNYYHLLGIDKKEEALEFKERIKRELGISFSIQKRY